MHSSLVGLKNLTGTARYIHAHLGGEQVRRDHPVYSLAYPFWCERSGGCGDCSTPLRLLGLIYHFDANGVVDVEVVPPPFVCAVDGLGYPAYVLAYSLHGALRCACPGDFCSQAAI